MDPYNDELNDILVEYLNPERETFKEFIFRDSKGLYKYDTSDYKKIYIDDKDIDVNRLLIDTCKEFDVKSTEAARCNKFLIEAILNFDSKSFTDIYRKIRPLINNNFFNNVTKDDIKKMDHKVIILILKNFEFKVIKQFNNIYNMELNMFESTTDWLSRVYGRENTKSPKFIFLIKYLQNLVDMINSNPTILNPITEYISELYYMKEYEEFMISNYNKNAIYNDIILSNFDIMKDNTIDNFNDTLINDLYKQQTLTKQLLLLFAQERKKLIEHNVDISIGTDLFKYFATRIKNLKQAEDKILENLVTMVKYLKINPKDNMDMTTMTKKTLSIDDMKKQIDYFMMLKSNLAILQEDFIKKYPKKNFFIYN